MVNNAKLRQFIIRYFSDPELDELCFDYYPDLLNQFTVGMTKSQKVIALINYCERRSLLPHLLATLDNLLPVAYQTQFGRVPKRWTGDYITKRDPNRIFLSHASQDATFAQQLADDLRHNGFDVWMAPESIEPGEKWVDAIERGLETCGIFVLVITPHAVVSNWVRDESNYAIALQNKGEMRFIALHVDESLMPPMWSVRQQISFRDEYNQGLNQLLAALRTENFAAFSNSLPDTATPRVRYQLELEERKGLMAALDFLSRELETTELNQNEELFARLMQLYWQTGKWRQARDRARSFASRVRSEDAALKSELWHGLTAMAEFLSRGQQTHYEAEMQTTYAKIVVAQPSLLAILNEQRRWLIDWRIDTLLAEAEQLSHVTQDTPWLKIIECYAEAYGWAPDNRRIVASIQMLRVPLLQTMTRHIQAAHQIALQGSLRDSVERVEVELATLRTIKVVAQPIGLKEEQQIDIEVAIEQLTARLEPWQIALSMLESAERERDNALRHPKPFQGNEGGWNFQRARKQFHDAFAIARGDVELQHYVLQLEDELDALEVRASELNSLVFHFRQAVLDEDFDEATQCAQLLNSVWRLRRENDGFNGLEDLIRIAYPYSRKPSTLADHIKLAQHQKRNLQEWTEWADRAKHILQDLMRIGDEQRGTLDMLKTSRAKSLATIINDCDKVIHLYSQFSSLVAARPVEEPESNKALEQQERLSQTMIAELGSSSSSYWGRAMSLRAEAEQQLSQLEQGPLMKLHNTLDQLEKVAQQVGKKSGIRGASTAYIPESLFKEAEFYFMECAKIDFMNADLKHLNAKLATYHEKRDQLR